MIHNKKKIKKKLVKGSSKICTISKITSLAPQFVEFTIVTHTFLGVICDLWTFILKMYI